MKSFYRKYKKYIIGVVIIAALYGAYKISMPFKYLDNNAYTFKQRRQIVAEMKKIQGDSVKSKAVEDASKASKKTYREELEKQAEANYKAANG